MNVAVFVTPFPSLSETFILNQITGLVDHGHAVDIYPSVLGDTDHVHAEVARYHLLNRTFAPAALSPMPLRRYAQALSVFARHAVRAPLRTLRALRPSPDVKPSIHQLMLAAPLLPSRTYDVIHCHFGPNGLRAQAMRDIGALRGPLVTTFHGYDVNRHSIRQQTGYYDRLFARGELFTVNTTYTSGRAQELGCPAERIEILPVGLDMCAYTFHEKTLATGEPARILSVARLTEKKGLEYAIRAVANLQKQGRSIEFNIIGDGDLREPLTALIADQQAGAFIKLLGWRNTDEVRDAYRAHHLFLLPSVTAADGDMEGQGLVLQEAQAMGLPVLSTLHNGIPDGVLDGETGYLVPERDVDALADKLSRLLEEAERWPAMGRRAREFVAAHYDINMLNDRLVQIYEKAITAAG